MKWLPCDEENLIATCGRDGFVRLLNIKGGVSRRLATHYAATHKLAVHPDTPHIIISVGEDSKVLSIDIREQKPTKYAYKDDHYLYQYRFVTDENDFVTQVASGKRWCFLCTVVQCSF